MGLNNYIDNFARHYQKEDVVKSYLSKRFAYVLWKMADSRERHIINGVLKDLDACRLLEIALGPARVSERLVFAGSGVGLDSSIGMLEDARRKLRGKPWTLVNGDAFDLPFKKYRFDCVICLRFIRHFDLSARRLLFKEINRVLKDGGLMIFEALNQNMGDHVRRSIKLGSRDIHDYMWTYSELEKELRENNFRIIEFHGIIKHFYMQDLISRLFSPFVRTADLGVALVSIIDRWKSKKCLQWDVVCRKI